MKRILVWVQGFVLLATWCAANSACAQYNRILEGNEQAWIFEVIVDAAPAPEPALKHRLWPENNRRKAGNAAPHYHRAIGLLHADLLKEVLDLIAVIDPLGNPGKPLSDFPTERARQCVANGFAVLNELEVAVSRDHCDWGIRVQDLSGPETMSLRLGEFSSARNLARLIRIQALLAIMDHDLDKALRSIQMGFQLAHDVAQCPTVITQLIGVSIAAEIARPVMYVIAEPGSPNLYWALASIPQPLIDHRPAFEHELNWVFKYSLIRDAELPHADEEWKRLFYEAFHEAEQLRGTSSSDRTDAAKQWAGIQLLLSEYARAKQELTRFGLTAEHIEQMPVIQVVALHEAKVARHKRDEYLKLLNLPNYQSLPLIRAAERHRPEAVPERLSELEESLPLFARLRPDLGNALQPLLRTDRRMDRMMAIEALRLHAAVNGKFPEKLADIKVVPVPIDSFTGQAITYRLEGEMAVLEFRVKPELGIPAYGEIIRLKLRKAK